LDPKTPVTWTPPTELLPHQRDSIKVRDFNQRPDAILANFAEHVFEKRIRIREFFEQHDPLRQGLITTDKFEGVLTLFGCFWTEGDFACLTNRYRTTKNFTEYVRWQVRGGLPRPGRGQRDTAAYR
jgi:hypothetical protein